jgi:glycerol-3-phosphate acyltransferase PlsY
VPRLAGVDAASIVVVCAAYLVGSIDLGVILPRLAGVDIYSVGSGNPGATNVLRAMGRGAAAAVVLGDVAKGFCAALTGDLVGGEVVGFAAGFFAVAGHCYPLWHRFRGGRGVATTGGMTIWMEWPVAAILLPVWIGLVALTRKASLASLIAVVALTPCFAAFGARDWSLVWAGAAAALVVVRHVPNIRRLISGSEHGIKEAA